MNEKMSKVRKLIQRKLHETEKYIPIISENKKNDG